MLATAYLYYSFFWIAIDFSCIFFAFCHMYQNTRFAKGSDSDHSFSASPKLASLNPPYIYDVYLLSSAFKPLIKYVIDHLSCCLIAFSESVELWESLSEIVGMFAPQIQLLYLSTSTPHPPLSTSAALRTCVYCSVFGQSLIFGCYE